MPEMSLFESMFEINVAIVMVAVSIAIFVWFHRSHAAASARRVMLMMTRVGLRPELVTDGDRQTKAILKEVRQRCQKCRFEDVCDRWIAGETEGNNAFCPNAQTFRSLT